MPKGDYCLSSMHGLQRVVKIGLFGMAIYAYN